MHGHLVTIEVCVERGTNKRMKLDRLTFYKNRLECLDTQTMQCRCTVQHNRMLLNDVLKDIPYCRLKLLYHFLGIFDVVGSSVGNKLFHNERFEQLDSHLLRKTTLIDLQFRSYDDYRTSGIVNSFTEKVLTETSGFTLQHIGKGFQSSVSRSCYRTSTASVIDQGIYSLLQHTLLVADNDIRSTKLQKSFQTVVSVDDPSVKIIQVRCCKTSSVQLYHRTKIRRDNRDNGHDHPLRTVAGLTEGLHNLKTFDDPCTFLACCVHKLCLQFFRIFFKIDSLKELHDGLGTHTYTESFSVRLTCFLVLTLGEYLFVHKSGICRIQNDIVSKVKHFLQCSRRNIKDQTHTGRNSFKVPDMRHRSCKLDVSHTLSTNGRFGYFNTASVADNAFIANFFVLSTVALPVLARSENPFTEKTILLRLQGSVVDRFRF